MGAAQSPLAPARGAQGAAGEPYRRTPCTCVHKGNSPRTKRFLWRDQQRQATQAPSARCRPRPGTVVLMCGVCAIRATDGGTCAGTGGETPASNTAPPQRGDTAHVSKGPGDPARRSLPSSARLFWVWRSGRTSARSGTSGSSTQALFRTRLVRSWWQAKAVKAARGHHHELACMRDSPGPLGAPAAGAFPCEPLLPLTVVRSCWHQLLRAYWSKARWPRPGVGLESGVESGVHLFTPSTAAEKCAEGPIPPTPGWGGREGEALRLGGLGTCSACSHRSSYASGLICLLPQFVLRASSARPHGASSGSGNGLERRRRPSRREARCSSGAVGGGRG